MEWPTTGREREGPGDGKIGARVGSEHCCVLDLGTTDTHKTGN